MKSFNPVFEEVLKEIIPTEQELALIEKVVKNLKNFLEKKAKELRIKYTRIEPQGSTGIKQTQLRENFDIDLFIGLNYDLYKPNYRGLSKNKLKKESKKDFLKLCNNWIIKALHKTEFKNPRLLYAEHPYVKVDYITKEAQIEIDIVLYFDLDLDYIKKYGPITAVDRSPWHGRFVKDDLSKEQKNDVRLLKQFFKSCHSYGDKSAVGKIGFIGYSAELLIHHFKNIQNLFESFHKLNDTPLDFFKRNKQDLKKIPHFENDFLILIDPIDKNRNVASAISEKAYRYCNYKIGKFLKSPSKGFFELEKIPEAKLSNITDPLYIVELKNIDDTVHYTINRDKLYSLSNSIKANGEKEFSHAVRFGNIYFEIYFEDKLNEYNIALYCEKPKISQKYIRRGPPIKEKTHTEKFKKKNPNFIEKDGFLWIESQRNYTEFLEFLKDFVNNKIPENIKIVNISEFSHVKTVSGKRTIYVLKNMVLPFV